MEFRDGRRSITLFSTYYFQMIVVDWISYTEYDIKDNMVSISIKSPDQMILNRSPQPANDYHSNSKQWIFTSDKN